MLRQKKKLSRAPWGSGLDRPGTSLRYASCSAWAPAQTIPSLGVRCSVGAHPPAFDDPPVEFEPDYDPLAQPETEMEFDQQIHW